MATWPEKIYWNAFTLWQVRHEAQLPYWPLQKILALQNQRVRAIVAHAYHTVPFYREVMDQQGLRPQDLRTADDLAPLLREVADAVGVPVTGVVSDGQTSIRRAVERALPGVPHQLCQFHFLREAARPVFEADRHAKKTLKKHIRGVRRIERAVEDVTDPQAEVVRGYCAAVRSAITDDGHPPLAASGLKLKGRLEAVADSVTRVTEKGGRRRRLSRCGI